MSFDMQLLVIEVVGLLLVWIEIRKKELARRIEEYIDDLGKIKFPPRKGDVKYKYTWKIFICIELITMISIWIWLFSILPEKPVTKLQIFSAIAEQFGITLAPITSFCGVLLLFTVFLFGPIVAPILVFICLRKMIELLNYISGGHALGSIGLILAIIGFLLEALEALLGN
jgi:Fe2+ transport system protein B